VSLAELLGELRAARFAPVYLFYGEERLLVDEAAAAVREAVLAGAPADFNFDRFRGKEVDAGALENALWTMPMMAARRLVLVQEAESLSPAARDAVLRFCADPSPTTVLLLVALALDARGALPRAAARAGRAVKFEAPYERELPGWCRERARAAGASLDEDAARLLVAAVGRDLAGLAGALERLSLYVGPGGRIDAAAVEAVVPETRTQSIFALCDAVGGGEVRRAWEMARKILAQREPPLRVLAMLARHFRTLGRLRELREAGRTREAAGAEVGVPPFALRNLWPQTERRSFRELGRAMELVHEADVALKSSRLPGEMIVERLVLDLSRLGGRGSATSTPRRS
jgi:DNA polymerase-3 subunit delta